MKSKKRDTGFRFGISSLIFHHFYSIQKVGVILVEVEGVEPSSEHIAIQLSPSADSILCFAPTPPADRLRHR